jgi:LysM repeat protein
MKRISILLLAAWLSGGLLARAQDAAVEERLNKLTEHIEILLAGKAEQDKRIAALVKEVEGLREQVGKPVGNYASAEDVRKLADVVKEVDRKRVADNEEIAKQIEIIAKAASGGGKSDGRPGGKKKDAATGPSGKDGTSASTSGRESGFEHEIASGDTLSTIAEAYRAKGVKVTAEEILKANPGLKERSLRVGQKIFVPAPK